MIILIPTFQPTDRLATLVSEIRAADPVLSALVVDDGSGHRFQKALDAARRAGAVVIGYPRNRGKGQALKTGFGYIQRHYPGEAVVCADSDGQHAVPDILRVAGRLKSMEGRTLVLGERRFTGEVPLRSRAGNALTRRLFTLTTGRSLHDTQTGLRGYPAAMLPWLQTVRGDRYEYELNVLLQSARAGHRIESTDIATIYIADNDTSHFRPVVDSFRVYAPFLWFSLSSLTAFGIDLAVFLLLGMLSDSLLLAVLGARLVSATINFTVNRTMVFRARRGWLNAAIRYCSLAVGLVAANYALLFLLTDLGLPDLPAKILTEATLFLMSYRVQKRFLSGKRGPGATLMPGIAASQLRHSIQPDRRRRTPHHHLENNS